MNAAVSMGYRSHQATTCGLHVHISRDAFGRTEQAQEAAIARLLFFVEKHWNELLKFSRRTNRQLERWAAVSYKHLDAAVLCAGQRGRCRVLHKWSGISYRGSQLPDNPDGIGWNPTVVLPADLPSGAGDWLYDRKRRAGHHVGAVSYTHLDVYKRQMLCR